MAQKFHKFLYLEGADYDYELKNVMSAIFFPA